MNAYTTELQRQLARNEVVPVLQNLLDTLISAGAFSKELKEEIEPLQDEIIMLKSRYIGVTEDRERNLISPEDARIEIAQAKKILLKTLNNLEDDYPGLEKYFAEQEEEKAWAIATAANDIEAYQAYFTQYPNGKYREETQRLIRELQAIEDKKRELFRQKAEEEKNRRQGTESKTISGQKTITRNRISPMRYVYIGLGALLVAAAIFFIREPAKVNKADLKDVKEAPLDEKVENPRADEPEDKPPQQDPPNRTEEPTKPKPGSIDPGKLSIDKLKDQELLTKIPTNTDALIKTGAQAWQGTWTSTFGALRLKVQGNRVYGDYKNIGTIEGYYNSSSQSLKGSFTNGTRKGSIYWKIDGKKMSGNWYFNDNKTQNGKWEGEKKSSTSPSLQNFPWMGVWKTDPFGNIELTQKGNVVSGKGDTFAIANATYNAQSKELTGILTDAKVRTTAKFSITVKNGQSFSGKWAYTTRVKSGIKSSGTFYGKRIK